MIDLNETLVVMEKAAIDAAIVLSELQPKSIRLESRKDFLTDADLKSEKVIISTLRGAYPNIPILSEESSDEETRGDYLWIVDPLDGTVNFFLQDDYWGISIALIHNGITIAGLIHLPARKQLFSTSHETVARFCSIDGRKSNRWTNLQVNQKHTMADSQFWLAWGKEEHGGDDHRKVYDVIRRLDQNSIYPGIRNSATAEMMMVALGNISGYVFLKPEPFDIAAAGLIIEQAGGRVTDIDGNPWGPFSQSIVASNGVLHKDLLRVIK